MEQEPMKVPRANQAGQGRPRTGGPPGRASKASYLEKEESQMITCVHIFNAFLFLLGLGAAAVSLWAWIDLSGFESLNGLIGLLGPLFYVTIFTPIAEGGVLLFIFAIGTLGLCFKSRFTLVCYFGLLLLLCVVSLVLVAISLTLYFELSATLRSSMTDMISDQYDTTGYESVTDNIDSIQIEFECCGWDIFTDWEESTWYAQETNSRTSGDPVPRIPSSCCVVSNETGSSSSTSSQTTPSSSSSSSPSYVNLTECMYGTGILGVLPNDYMHSMGCRHYVKEPLETKILILGGAGLGLFIVQLTCLGLLINLFRKLGPRSPAQMKFQETDTARETLDKLDYWLDRETEELKIQSAKRKKKTSQNRKSAKTLSEK